MSGRGKGPLTRHEAVAILACEGGVEVWSCGMARTLRRIARGRPGLVETEEAGKDHPDLAGRRARPALLARATARGTREACAALRRGINGPRLLAWRRGQA
jgi:hypothetical protein